MKLYENNMKNDVKIGIIIIRELYEIICGLESTLRYLLEKNL